eukprot:7066475-Prymnesium_polylepis.1
MTKFYQDAVRNGVCDVAAVASDVPADFDADDKVAHTVRLLELGLQPVAPIALGNGHVCVPAVAERRCLHASFYPRQKAAEGCRRLGHARAFRRRAVDGHLRHMARDWRNDRRSRDAEASWRRAAAARTAHISIALLQRSGVAGRGRA